MGVIIDGNERKSIAEQVEENSKYKGRLIDGDLKIYKKDLPCFVRIMVVQLVDDDDDPDALVIYKGVGGVWKEMKTENKKLDLVLVNNDSGNKAEIWEVSGDTLIKSSWAYGSNDMVLRASMGYENYFMIIPLEYLQ